MSDKKQSSVEYAVEKLEKLIPPGNQIIISLILQQAKAMHKKEMKQTYFDGWHRNMGNRDEDFEQYYNETFNADEG